MSRLLGVYVDGETKTGKGTVSKEIARVLTDKGLHVYYDVAGDFYRRYVAHVRRYLGLHEEDALPTGSVLEKAARVVHEGRLAFEKDDSLGDLQRPAIGKSVSVLGELAQTQQAAAEWWAITIRQAHKEGAQVLVVDGRNPRLRIEEATRTNDMAVSMALNLYLDCEPEEAARRTLLGNGIGDPTPEQIATEAANVVSRRERDRHRADNPFILPTMSVAFVPGEETVEAVVKQSWQQQPNGMELPLTIALDNTHIPKLDMLAAVSALAWAAIGLVLVDERQRGQGLEHLV